MSDFALAHLSDRNLLDELTKLVAAERVSTAALLAHIAEVDARRLFLPAACPSMYVYCVQVLRLSGDAAYRRITAARAARRFPVLFEAVADGRLHLTAVVMLAPHLTRENVDELVAEASHRKRGEIARMLACRFPQPDVPAGIQPLPDPMCEASLALARVAGVWSPGWKVSPLSSGRFALQVTISEATHDKVMRAQALLRHRVPSGDLCEVLDRALDSLLQVLERECFAASDRPRARGEVSVAPGSRHVPSAVKRAVHRRDGERCSFVSEAGERCSETGFLELDHIDPVARGGQASEEGMRVLCRAHNQFEAERVLGSDFMKERRAEAKATRTTARVAEAGRDGHPERVLGEGPETIEEEVTIFEERLRAALAVQRQAPGSRCSEPGARPWGSMAWAGSGRLDPTRCTRTCAGWPIQGRVLGFPARDPDREAEQVLPDGQGVASRPQGRRRVRRAGRAGVDHGVVGVG
jgi:hypothetical protein